MNWAIRGSVLVSWEIFPVIKQGYIKGQNSFGWKSHVTKIVMMLQYHLLIFNFFSACIFWLLYLWEYSKEKAVYFVPFPLAVWQLLQHIPHHNSCSPAFLIPFLALVILIREDEKVLTWLTFFILSLNV